VPVNVVAIYVEYFILQNFLEYSATFPHFSRKYNFHRFRDNEAHYSTITGYDYDQSRHTPEFFGILPEEAKRTRLLPRLLHRVGVLSIANCWNLKVMWRTHPSPVLISLSGIPLASFL